MKLFFISDLHGSYFYLEKAIDAFIKENADYIILVGDILNHGPRNPIPDGYNPPKCAKLLNSYSEKIISVRGNCDSEVDQMLLEFPILSDYSIILYNNKRLFVSHGHIYNPENLPKLSKGDVFIFGHVHLPIAEYNGNVFVLNPGSITFPKESNPNSYGILKDGIFKIKDLDGNVVKSIAL